MSHKYMHGQLIDDMTQCCSLFLTTVTNNPKSSHAEKSMPVSTCHMRAPMSHWHLRSWLTFLHELRQLARDCAAATQAPINTPARSYAGMNETAAETITHTAKQRAILAAEQSDLIKSSRSDTETTSSRHEDYSLETRRLQSWRKEIA